MPGRHYSTLIHTGVRSRAFIVSPGLLQKAFGAASERALRLGDRLGGHVMLGHVDGIERVLSLIDEEGGGQRIRFSVAPEAASFVAPKGSVAVSGVSLTIASLGPTWFEVAAIPHTLAVTSLGTKPVGAPVNLEVDVLAKYVERLLPGGGPAHSDGSER